MVAEQISFLKSEYERQKTLYEEKITSQKNYLKAESDFRQAKGMYQRNGWTSFLKDTDFKGFRMPHRFDEFKVISSIYSI
jgi:hypothetical protein